MLAAKGVREAREASERRDVVEAAAPERRAVGLLQGDDVRLFAFEDARDELEVAPDGGVLEQALVLGLAPRMRDVERHQAQGIVAVAGKLLALRRCAGARSVVLAGEALPAAAAKQRDTHLRP